MSPHPHFYHNFRFISFVRENLLTRAKFRGILVDVTIHALFAKADRVPSRLTQQSLVLQCKREVFPPSLESGYKCVQKVEQDRFAFYAAWLLSCEI